jgi:hypothetical protein
MYFTWSATESEQRRSEMLQQAEHERLVRTAVGEKPFRIHVRTLAWVGRRMTALGIQLQQYGQNEEDIPDWSDVPCEAC